MKRVLPATAVGGILAIAGNGLAIVFLAHTPHAYRPGDLGAWHRELLADPTGAVASSILFTVGLIALAVFALGLPRLGAERAGEALSAGAALLAGGALLNASGTLAPLILVRFVPPDAEAVARALLGWTLCLDATFNLCLGLGLILMSAALVGEPKFFRLLGLLAGLANLPVSLQPFDDRFAALLAFSGPLWLLWLALATRRCLATHPNSAGLQAAGS